MECSPVHPPIMSVQDILDNGIAPTKQIIVHLLLQVKREDVSTRLLVNLQDVIGIYDLFTQGGGEAHHQSKNAVEIHKSGGRRRYKVVPRCSGGS